MAYRRKQGNPSSEPPAGDDLPPPSSAAAQAIRASSAYRDSSLSSAYAEYAFSAPSRQARAAAPPEGAKAYEYTSIKNLSESRGFWGVLAQKAKNIIELESTVQQDENFSRNYPGTSVRPARSQIHHSEPPAEGYPGTGNPKLQRGLDKITSSLNYIGGKVGSTLEEGLSIVETRTASIIQETRKLNIRRKGSGSNAQTWMEDASSQHTSTQLRMGLETQLKAARDVSNAMAAKAKLLMRELKTMKTDLAFAKERCAQLEEENKILRESDAKGGHPEDDDLIRLQLESLLAEKSRLAQENSVYARENRFLREIVEYHQLTMQDVIYLDEGIEEITEVYPIHSPTLSSQVPPVSPSLPKPANFLPHNSFGHGSSTIFPVPPSQITEEKQVNSEKNGT